MPCERVALPGGGTAIVCTPKRRGAAKAREIPLADIEAACRECLVRGEAAWSRVELKERLVDAEATWNLVGLADVPVAARKALLSDLRHHPSWWKAKRTFCAALPVRRLNYDELAAACTALGWQRPSQIDDAGRLALFALLDDRAGLLWQKVRALREAPAPAPAPSVPPAVLKALEEVIQASLESPPAGATAPPPAPRPPRRAARPASAYVPEAPAAATDAAAQASALDHDSRCDSEALRARWPYAVRFLPADRLPEPFLSELLAELQAQVEASWAA